jgi:hypothetical protein
MLIIVSIEDDQDENLTGSHVHHEGRDVWPFGGHYESEWR